MASYTLHIQYVDRPAETRTFTQAKITFGRDAGDVVLHDSQVSGRHGEITFDGNTLRFTDVGSTNGSFLIQGQRVANIELTPGIALRLGNSLITVQAIDAPNVAGKGRTVIAGPGMAPGFPAPMRPPGPGPVVAAGAPIPRPPAPQPVAPGAPPPGGFAFAPTAQMQSPAMPGTPPSQQARPAFSAAPPQPGGPPGGGFSGAPPQPVFAGAPPQPVFAGAPPQPVFSTPQSVPPGPPPGAVMPVAVAPEPEDDPTPMPTAPEVVEAEELAVQAVATPQASAEAPKDLVTGIKQGLAGGWAVIQPVFVTATIMYAAVAVTYAGISSLLATLALKLGWGWLITLVMWLIRLLSLGMLVGFLVVIPSIVRHVLGSYLGVPMDPKSAIQDTIKNAGDRVVNCTIAMIPLGIFAGPIYFVEGKKLGPNVTRNWQLLPKDIATILLTLLVGGVASAVGIAALGFVLGLVPFLGPVLVAIGGALVQSAFFAYFMGVGIYFYFTLRRRLEGGDPEAEGRAALGGVAALPQ